MAVLLAGKTDSYAQFITVLAVFVLVLAVTAAVTKWIAGYQKQQCANMNIEVIEMTRITNNKYIQIVRVGETYLAIAVCKDTVTLLGEIPEEQLNRGDSGQGFHFREFLDKAIKRNETESVKAEDNQSDDRE
ncbi:hypothetical protein IMSAG185_00294 [Lachnospiraceae bacterium]|jgi:flagellar protein FliO/FliZ|nr:flagellar biosynthetic protein FliO [Lachnospiraceae bacterium]GFI64704.1 hypothetical protein IMSAG185_00294 [Lachnospiraceae bacterium]